MKIYHYGCCETIQDKCLSSTRIVRKSRKNRCSIMSYYNLIACMIQEWKCYMARTISGWAVVVNVMHKDLRQPFQDIKATVMCLENSTPQPDVWDLEF